MGPYSTTCLLPYYNTCILPYNRINTFNGHGTLQGSTDSLLQYRKHRDTAPPQQTQISIFRNNVLTRKNLHSKNLVASPLCRFCAEEETLHHRLISCRTSKPIWDIVNRILMASDLVPVYDREIYLTDYESGVYAIQNQIIMYTRWFIDQAKMQEDRPSPFSFPTALFNVLDSQYNQLDQNLIKKNPL